MLYRVRKDCQSALDRNISGIDTLRFDLQEATRFVVGENLLHSQSPSKPNAPAMGANRRRKLV